MANEEHVERLLRSVKEWNDWRREHPEIRPDLSRANLSHAHLNRADLSRAILAYADLSYAVLTYADPSYAVFHDADISHTDLSYINLSHANLSHTNISHTISYSANLNGANLSHTDFTNTRFRHTLFINIDLSNIKGLETTIHDGPSTVDINSVILPRDEHTRLHFLRGVGFTETQIEYLPSLLTSRPIEYHSLFISYASQDEVIARQLYADLRKKDVPCWFAPHDLRPGTPILRGIEEAIHLQDKFLLILSEHAVKSAWIEREVDAALHLEIQRGQDVLFPIRLDNAVLESNTSWATRLQHRHIGDFTGWRDESFYQQAFTTLLQHLKVTKTPAR